MRQMLIHRFPIVLAAALLTLSLTGLPAAEGNSVTLKVQGVLATGAAKATPDMAPSLKPYANVLKRFAYGKYEDIGGGSSVVGTGRTSAIKVGSHTVEARLMQLVKGTAKISYTVKDSKGAPIGSNAMSLAPGQIMPIQIGDPAFPIILLFQSGK